MYITNSIKFLILLILTLTSSLAYSQLSKTHYIPPLTSAEFGNANPEEQYFYISTPSGSDIPYTIKPIGQTAANYITGTVSNTNPDEIYIGTGNGQLFIPSNETSTVINDRGYIIEAEDVIYVSVRMRAGGGAQAGALVSKGLSALDTTFRIGTFTNETPQDNYLNFASVMATEDDTQVNISDLPASIFIKGDPTNTTPVNFTLNKGESYIIATNSFEGVGEVNEDALIGALIESNKPIVVNCGSSNGSFHNGFGRDYGIDQIAGLSKVGKKYIFVKGGGTNDWENVLIVPHTNGTTISINGNVPFTITDKYYLIEGDQYNANGNMYVETSEDVFAYQGIGSISEANQGMFFVPPLSCETRGNINNIANINLIGGTQYNGGVSIVTKNGATVTINNLPLTNYAAIGPSAVTGNPDYVTYKVNNLNGNISVQGNDELYVAYYNVNGAATSGSFYSGFPSSPEINFDAQFVTLGNCIPNITLSAANTQNFDSFEWWFDDGSGLGFVNTNISTPDLTPTVPGKYKLIGIITCSGLTLESIEVPVSICPDDTDNDGIIDNIDIDNDNDGILNCTESKGNTVINLSNLITPELIFQDASTNSSFISGTYTQSSSSGGTNTFSGTSTGNFTSTVQPAINAENDYTISFTEPVNVKFAEDIATTHISTDGEYFIAKISPVNKNITLIDPDNHLLVDSNFDGIFETGVYSISGSEIHFKINPTQVGTRPYEFFANQVDGFTFEHILSNINDTSTFNGNISLTCFKLDSDLDGIKDEFDLDSDNDGIPDIIENGGELVTVSNVDVDLNGLDDVFDIIALPIDTDADGIPDFYDLDSDNDGIYDLIETGQLGLLSDTNLDGIEDGPTYGSNGWADAAETNPDSGLLGYVLNDEDTDTIFTYLDLDSDGDLCSDVIEAGFSDGNGDDLLGDNIVTVNGLGLVNNATDGYIIPHPNYLIAAPITITTQPIDTVVCESSNTIISVISSAIDSYQWEVSTDGINWSSIIDNAIYNGALTSDLNIVNAPLAYQNNKYRIFLNRNGNSCGLYSEEITLTVNALPIINNPVTLVQCDDDTDGFSAFNLTQANDKISNNASNETFTYYLTQASAINGDINSPDYIVDPTVFINRSISNDVVWARITSQFDCAVVSEVQLRVSTTAIPITYQRTFNVCDDFLDINGNNNVNNDNRDGVASFNFSSVTAEVLAFIPPGQNPLTPRYYRNEIDALAEVNEITDITNYRNIDYPGTQQIYIRVDSDLVNDCLGLGAHITLNVESLPIANAVTINRQCDDDQDGLFPFDVSLVELTVLNGQNLNDVTVTYFDENNNPLPSPLPNPFLTRSQTITIRVTNNSTSDPNGACFDETNLEFIVDELPIAHPVIIPPVCDDDDNDTDGLYSFNTSSIETNLLQGQIGMEVHYFDSSGQELSSPLPNPFITETQTITATVINPINNTCFDSTDLEFIVNPLPSFSIETTQLVCSSDPTFTVTLDPIEANTLEVYNYEWVFEDGTILSDNSTLTVSTPGTYTIKLTKTDGTNCSRSRTVFVNASELATITLDDITIVDISDNNSISIDTTNLGLGDYEFSLDNEFSFYQDEPFFNNVSAGLHTLYVRDKKGCGTTSLEISIIGYPKFFTPNGDGYHDTWQVKGISSNFQPNSTIYIFDRYGKLIKQLNPLGIGWDGTFNGNILPTSDYWFKVLLQDGREINGHFTLKR